MLEGRDVAGASEQYFVRSRLPFASIGKLDASLLVALKEVVS